MHTGDILEIVESHRSIQGSVLSIATTATLSVVMLIGIAGWQIVQSIGQKDNPSAIVASAAVSTGANGVPSNNTNAESIAAILGTGNETTDPSQISDGTIDSIAQQYSLMQEQGDYTATDRKQVAASIAASIHPDIAYTTYNASDIPTDTDISYARMLQYRADLQTSLKPLLSNGDPELTIYSEYVQTGNVAYLNELKVASANYKAATAATAKLTVPADAVSQQVAILNAMQEFSATLDAMIQYADDSITSAALLQNYTRAQTDMAASFNNIALYFKSKQQ